jgi:hypothetical protein
MINNHPAGLGDTPGTDGRPGWTHYRELISAYLCDTETRIDLDPCFGPWVLNVDPTRKDKRAQEPSEETWRRASLKLGRNFEVITAYLTQASAAAIHGEMNPPMYFLNQ